MKLAVAGFPLLSQRQWALYQVFEERGIETHLLVPPEWKTDIPASDHPPENAPFEVHEHRAVFNEREGMYVTPGVLSSIRNIDPDAVLTHGEPWHLFSITVSLACSALNVPHVDFTWENLERMPRARVQRALERLSLPMYDGVLCGSPGARERIRTRGYTGPTAVAPQSGVDVAHFAPQAADRSVYDSFGVPGGSDVVLFAGRWATEKGVNTLLDTVPAVIREHPDAHYLFVGGGPEEDRLKRRVGREGLEGSVTVVPERQPYGEMPGIMATASVFAYPSRTVETWAEQFGFAVAEAMSCGTPVVTTECGALPHVVGDTGVVCPENDDERLSSGIIDLLDRKQNAVVEARQRVFDEFSLEAVARKHLDFVRDVVAD